MPAVFCALTLRVTRPAARRSAGQRHQAERGRDVQHQHHPHGLRDVVPHAFHVVGGGVAGDAGDGGGGDRHAEEADRQVHQPEGESEIGDGAFALAGGQVDVHQLVHLDGGESQRPPESSTGRCRGSADR